MATAVSITYAGEVCAERSKVSEVTVRYTRSLL